MNLDFYRQWCKDSFGADLWPNTARTNFYFGGVHLNVDNLIMTNGIEVNFSDVIIIRIPGDTQVSPTARNTAISL